MLDLHTVAYTIIHCRRQQRRKRLQKSRLPQLMTTIWTRYCRNSQRRPAFAVEFRFLRMSIKPGFEVTDGPRALPVWRTISALAEEGICSFANCKDHGSQV